MRSFASSLVTPAVALALVACGDDDPGYIPRTAPSGVSVSLPAVPSMPSKPIQVGDAYTIWGASYYQRSRIHRDKVAGKEIKLVGYITKTNFGEAPECAVHETGKEDKDGCAAPIPAFWMGDTKDAPEKEWMKVEGFASNFAQIYDAVKEYKKRAKSPKKDDKPEPIMDGFWGNELPNPLPVKGMKVVVKGNYSTTFSKATQGLESDPIMGIMTFTSYEVQENVEEVATLPGMK